MRKNILKKKIKEVSSNILPEFQNLCSLIIAGRDFLANSRSPVLLYISHTIALRRGGWLQKTKIAMLSWKEKKKS